MCNPKPHFVSLANLFTKYLFNVYMCPALQSLALFKLLSFTILLIGIIAPHAHPPLPSLSGTFLYFLTNENLPVFYNEAQMLPFP